MNLNTDDNDIEDDLASSTTVVYNLVVDVRNHRLAPGQRKALHDMFMQVLAQAKIKMQLVMQEQPDAVRVKGKLTTSSSGTRDLYLPGEDRDEDG